MKPIFIILYAVIITLVLTLAFPRLKQVGPMLRRYIWLATFVGTLVLLIVIFVFLP